jgi:hypothetical protein
MDGGDKGGMSASLKADMMFIRQGFTDACKLVSKAVPFIPEPCVIHGRAETFGDSLVRKRSKARSASTVHQCVRLIGRLRI